MKDYQVEYHSSHHYNLGHSYMYNQSASWYIVHQHIYCQYNDQLLSHIATQYNRCHTHR